MDKFLERFKPGGARKQQSKPSWGLNFGQKFHGEGKSLGGGIPGKVIGITLHEAGTLGISVEKRPNGTAIVGNVVEGSQAENAGIIRGDVICFQDSNGQEEVPYELFLELAKGSQRPVAFEVRRIETKSISKGEPLQNNRSAEAFARQQAVIAAAEKRERASKAINKKIKPTEKNHKAFLSEEERRKIEKERLERMDLASKNQSNASREAVEAVKLNEAKTAAQLGYNPYETKKVTAGQARNTIVGIQNTEASGTYETNSSAVLPAIQPPMDPAGETAYQSEKKESQVPVSHDFQAAYELVITSNDHATVVSSFSILRKLIRNATTKGQGEDETDAEKFRKVRLGNSKIKEAIVEVEGALDMMMAVGFQLVEKEGESFLAFPRGFKGDKWLPAALIAMENYEKS